MQIAVGVAVVVGLLVVSGYAYVGSKAFRMELGDFRPTEDGSSAGSTAAASAMSALAEPIHWRLSDGSLQRAFYVPSRNGALVVYAHGAPGAASGFHELVGRMRAYGFGAIAVDLPGYGASEGYRNWDETYEESIGRAIDFASSTAGIERGRIGGYGFSMGTFVIVRSAAADDRLASIVLVSGFTNLHDQLMHQFRRRVPGVGWFAVAAARWSGVDVSRMDTSTALEKMTPRPVQIITGTKDHLIPVSMARRLTEAVGDQAELWVVEGAGHVGIDTHVGDRYYERLAGYWGTTLGVAEEGY